MKGATITKSSTVGIDPVKLTKDLIQIDSYKDEYKIAKYIEEELQKKGFSTYKDEVRLKRPNLIAELDNDKDGPTLMFCGHMDTVPPVSPSQQETKIKDGKMYGRGSADMKSGLAAIISALQYLSEHKDRWSGKILFLGTMGEETGLLGMQHYVKTFSGDCNIDGCIIAEPTSLKIGVAHKGMALFEIRTIGREAHGSRPVQGVNAIYHMALIIKEIEEKLRSILKKKSHTLLGTPTVNVSIIQGGTSTNVVPKECVIKVDRRVLPGENIEEVVKEINKVLLPLKDKYPSICYQTILKRYNGPFEMNAEHPFVSVVSKELSSVAEKQAEIIGLSFGTDASELKPLNVPTVVVGPGSPNQAHQEDEWVDIREIELATELYKNIALSLLGSTEIRQFLETEKI